MAEKNGWTKWLIRALVLVIISGVTTILTIQHKDLQAEVTTRSEKDEKLTDQIYEIQKENGEKFEHIAKQLVRNETNQQWTQTMLTDIKELIKNGN